MLSLGIIETVGLAAAIEAADICLKTANVSLVGYELTKGDGMAVVKIEGNVGAVNAAIEAAKVSALKVNKVISYKVLPRPSEQISLLIRNDDTVGFENIKDDTLVKNEDLQETVYVNENETILKSDFVVQEIETMEEKSDFVVEEIEIAEEVKSNLEVEENNENIITENIELNNDVSDSIKSDIDGAKKKIVSSNVKKGRIEQTNVCNICKDPNCTRKKGELRKNCIHYKK